MSNEPKLTVLRDEIARVTVEIIRLSGKRLSLAKKIGDIKQELNIPVEDLNIENDLKRIVIETCQKENIDNRFGLQLLHLLVTESKRIQREINN